MLLTMNRQLLCLLVQITSNSWNNKHEYTFMRQISHDRRSNRLPFDALDGMWGWLQVYVQNIRDLHADGKLQEMEEYILRAVSTSLASYCI